MIDAERLVAICAQPYRDAVGCLRAACCGKPVDLQPKRRGTNTPWAHYGLPERPCKCVGRVA